MSSCFHEGLTAFIYLPCPLFPNSDRAAAPAVHDKSHLPLINPYAGELVDFLVHILRDDKLEMGLKDSSALVRPKWTR